MNKEHPALSSQRYAHIMESGTCEGKGNNEATICKKNNHYIVPFANAKKNFINGICPDAISLQKEITAVSESGVSNNDHC